jgi:hypothetical protein
MLMALACRKISNAGTKRSRSDAGAGGASGFSNTIPCGHKAQNTQASSGGIHTVLSRKAAAKSLDVRFLADSPWASRSTGSMGSNAAVTS